ncbi:SprT-like domain-containing protein [Nocardioides sp. TRM66260-LWL]|uniref:SprT-like domain-containing protein n=1 Tax=Nocardioides sp. TRM66260-LWL TaxID=2874478 RepID=UPI001CC5D45A|nr:SprT-like domain-containing protein [Nocardioides sp. TRM66260-LWL]MBZ5735408.1 SprT-like domain-containing protein [Nocardioides sp. TRM66260-LWL]
MDLDAALRLATALLHEHGLDDWQVRLDSAKRRAGVCRHDRRIIGLSAPLTLLHAEAEVRETVLHEIAHALAGPEHQHDAVWRAIARRIGSTGARCVSPEAPRVEGAWRGVCPAGHVVERHRRPERVLSCGRCSRVFSLEHVYAWTHRGRPAPMHPNYLADLAAHRAGITPVRLGVGHRARIVVPGSHAGRIGVVVARGRTRYRLRIGAELLSVPFAGVEPA